MAVEFERKGMLLIISGPSGVGKGTLTKKLLATDPSFRLSCSATTRPPRVNEVEGIHYYFVSNEQYDQMVANDEFLEHAEVHGNRYGTLRRDVDALMKKGCNVLLDIDVQGALNVMDKAEDYVSIFILPPSYAVLRERLENRKTDTPEQIECRLNNARGEVALKDRYQYAVVNDELEPAFAQLEQIIEAEKMRMHRCNPTVPEC